MELVLMRRVIRVIFIGLPSLALCSCHSFALVPMQVNVRNESQVVHVRVWVSDQGLMEGYHWGAQAAFAIVLYPVNFVGGIARGVSAPFDSDYEIQCGLFGFVVGVIVPGFTLMPRLMRSDPWSLSVSTAEVECLSRVVDFDVSAAMTILNKSPFVSKERVIFIEVSGRRYPVPAGQDSR